jgi:hypothetical protein
MSSNDYITFIFNESYEFVSFEIHGEMTLYTSPDNFLGRTVKEVMPEDVATKTIMFIDKCFATHTPQEYDYNLGDGSYHSVLTLLEQNDSRCPSNSTGEMIMATITENH